MHSTETRAAGWLLGALILLCATAVADEGRNRLTADERAAGWLLLFDGNSLDQWRTYRETEARPQWQAIDGELTLTQRGGGDLITRATWDSFELSLEWKISEGGNSGIFFLADEANERIYYNAPEIQILDDARHPDNRLDTHRSGSLYDLIAAPPASQRPALEWNTVVITHVNGHLKVWQNGVQTVDVRIGGERWNALVADSKFAGWKGFGTLTSGHIGLQDHGDVVAFRNLKIRAITAAP
jgi:hypothetical protein